MVWARKKNEEGKNNKKDVRSKTNMEEEQRQAEKNMT